MSYKNVVVTGISMLNAAGLDLQTSWQNIKDGKSCIDKITLFDTSELETKIGAQISEDFGPIATKMLPKRDKKQMTRATQMGVVAGINAIVDSGIDFSTCEKERVAVIMGVITSAYNERERGISESSIIVKSMPNAPSAWLSLLYGLEGPNFNCSTACASSAYALSLGCDLIKLDKADVVIIGGADSHIDQECIRGFNQILALSIRNDSPKTACRPFTKTRDGFVIGEGAGVMILESEEHARKRNAKIYCKIAGYAITSEAFNIVSPKDDGVGMTKTMRMALKDANLNPEQVNYINAHGTSTYVNDRYETMAIKNVFGENAYKIPVSSTKSMIGHTIGAAGVIEGIVTIMSINENIVTPTINYMDPDPDLDLDYIPNASRPHNVDVGISNSFGFGGHNATIVYQRYK